MSTAAEVLVTRVALAIELVDDLTNREAHGSLVVRGSGNRLGVLNRSGYFLFFDVPAGTLHVSTQAEQYLPDEVDVALPRPAPLNPVVQRVLLPNQRYPFPPGTTTVRGLVTNPAGNPVQGATIAGVGRATRTDAGGHFVAYFRALDEDDVTVVAGRRLVKAGDGTTTFQLTVTHPSFQTANVAVIDIEEGRDRSIPPVSLTP
jgi:hypothetical protein